MKLSVLVPSIRKENLPKLYNSVKSSFSGDFEFVVIGPYGFPDEMKELPNIKWIEDWGSPIRAQQRGLTEAIGEYISWAADDGEYLPSALDTAFKLVDNEDYKTVIMGKYQEGERHDNHMEEDKYYILNNHHGSQAVFLPDNCWMLNCGILSKKILLELGGWDAKEFNVCPCAYNDLAVRLQKYGCKFIIQQELMFKCTHTPGETGDHGPIHKAQVYLDEPKFKFIWSHPYYSKRLAIDINNWKQAPEKWELRFGA